MRSQGSWFKTSRILVNNFEQDGVSGLINTTDPEGDTKMHTRTVILSALIFLGSAILIPAQNPPQQGGGMAMKKYNKDKHWPEYNKNMDEYITVDEAPQPPPK